MASAFLVLFSIILTVAIKLGIVWASILWGVQDNKLEFKHIVYIALVVYLPAAMIAGLLEKTIGEVPAMLLEFVLRTLALYLATMNMYSRDAVLKIIIAFVPLTIVAKLFFSAIKYFIG